MNNVFLASVQQMLLPYILITLFCIIKHYVIKAKKVAWYKYLTAMYQV